MNRATKPDRFASSTNPARNAAPAVFARGVPTACCTEEKPPGRTVEPGIAAASVISRGFSPARTSIFSSRKRSKDSWMLPARSNVACLMLRSSQRS